MVHPDDIAPSRATYARAFQDPGSVHTANVRYLHHDGSWRSLDVIGRATADETGRPVAILNSRDVTDRKRAEDQLRRAAEETKAAYDELKRAQAQLVQSEKLASVGMLVSGVAHEINNPINVIYGNLRLLKDGSDKPPRVVKQMIRDALRAADEARGVIDVFRNFARDSRMAEPSDINRCIKDTLEIARRWLTRIRVRTTLGRLPLVPCFPGQLNQVVLNLVKNAAEAMAGRGSIAITSFRRGRSVIIDVADSGPGIPAAIRPRLFDPFFSTKPEGMGLGLSISASIVSHHGGRLRLLKSSRKGSTFRIELPIKAKS
jgi:signal transduction histidine kinase